MGGKRAKRRRPHSVNRHISIPSNTFLVNFSLFNRGIFPSPSTPHPLLLLLPLAGYQGSTHTQRKESLSIQDTSHALPFLRILFQDVAGRRQMRNPRNVSEKEKKEAACSTTLTKNKRCQREGCLGPVPSNPTMARAPNRKRSTTPPPPTLHHPPRVDGLRLTYCHGHAQGLEAIERRGVRYLRRWADAAR